MGKSKIIYLVRHGQSEDNVLPIYQSPHSHLTSTGQKQAEFLAERVAKLPIEAIISSTYTRAKETAEIISSKIKKPVELSDLFVERKKPSQVEGRPHTDEAAAKLFNEHEESMYTPGLKVSDGENFEELKTRSLQALELLASRPEKNILVITHAGFLRSLLATVFFGEKLDGKVLRTFFRGVRSTENTGLSVFKYDDNYKNSIYGAGNSPWALWIWNDHAHLAEPKE